MFTMFSCVTPGVLIAAHPCMAIVTAPEIVKMGHFKVCSPALLIEELQCCHETLQEC